MSNSITSAQSHSAQGPLHEQLSSYSQSMPNLNLAEFERSASAEGGGEGRRGTKVNLLCVVVSFRDALPYPHFSFSHPPPYSPTVCKFAEEEETDQQQPEEAEPEAV